MDLSLLIANETADCVIKDPYTDEEVLVENEFKCVFDNENIDEEKFMQIDISDNEYITRINGI